MTKETRIIQWRKDSLFNKWCRGDWTATCKRVEVEQSLTPHTKTNSKWRKDLNVRTGIIKLFLEEHFNISHSRIFLDLPPNENQNKTQET